MYIAPPDNVDMAFIWLRWCPSTERNGLYKNNYSNNGYDGGWNYSPRFPFSCTCYVTIPIVNLCTQIYTQRRWWLFEIYITLVLLIACKWGNKHTLRRRTKSFCWRLLDSNKLQARVRGNCLFLFFNLSTPVVGRACLVL